MKVAKKENLPGPEEIRPVAVDIKGAAKYTGLSVAWFRKQVYERKIPFVIPNGTKRILFRYEDLDRMMTEGLQIVPGRTRFVIREKPRPEPPQTA
jgi:excisionase family DNA binding protein